MVELLGHLPEVYSWRRPYSFLCWSVEHSTAAIFWQWSVKSGKVKMSRSSNSAMLNDKVLSSRQWEQWKKLVDRVKKCMVNEVGFIHRLHGLALTLHYILLPFYLGLTHNATRLINVRGRDLLFCAASSSHAKPLYPAGNRKQYRGAWHKTGFFSPQLGKTVFCVFRKRCCIVVYRKEWAIKFVFWSNFASYTLTRYLMFQTTLYYRYFSFFLLFPSLPLLVLY